MRYENGTLVDKRGGIVKNFDMMPVNQSYYDTFQQHKYPYCTTDDKQRASMAQYKSRVGNFLDGLDRDLFQVGAHVIKNYVRLKPNTESFIKGFMLLLLKENVNNSKDAVSKEVLLWLLGM